MTEVTGGQVEVIVPASTYVRGGLLSPNGRWLLWGEGNRQDNHQRYLLNVETGERFDISHMDGGRRWITNEYIAFPNSEYLLLHVPDLTVRELEVIPPATANEVLKKANDVYVVKGFNISGSGTGLLSLDPAFPYAVREHIERDEVTINYTYMPDMLEGYEDGIVSPDGTLTAIRTNYPKEGFQTYVEIFHTNTGEIVATAYAEARSPRIMGWGADSRSVYFYERGRALDSDIERPIFKLTIDDPTGMGTPPKSDVALYRRAAQVNPSGWYIDDLLVEEAPVTPTPTPTATPLPTNTSTPTNTPTSTPLPTNTPTNTPSPTPTATPLPTNTSTPTATNTPTPTSTPSPTATNTPTVTPTSTPTPMPTNIGGYAVFGLNSVWLRIGSDLHSGNVGALDASNGAVLNRDSEVTIGRKVVFHDPASVIMGDSVTLKRKAMVNDLFYNELDAANNAVYSDTSTPLLVPLSVTLPPFPTITPGATDYIIGRKDSLELPAGAYGSVSMKKNSVLILTGGVYHFNNIDLGRKSQLLVTAPTEIRIANRLLPGSHVTISPSAAYG